VYHFSEDENIRIFEPHVAPTSLESTLEFSGTRLRNADGWAEVFGGTRLSYANASVTYGHKLTKTAFVVLEYEIETILKHC